MAGMAFNEHRFESSEGTKSTPEPDQKPSYQFHGDKPPAALAHLRDKRCWVAWDYRLKNGKWTKPPINPRTGQLASVTDAETWGTFDEALACMKRHDLAGVGLVLTDDGTITGIDLDHCISDAGTYSELAAEVLDFGETFAEVSPSGEGIRLFALGRVDRALKDDASGVEVYASGRYLTVTGNKVEEASDEIREAPRTLLTPH
jgi:primase-polymerase (primpol)-like protein